MRPLEPDGPHRSLAWLPRVAAATLGLYGKRDPYLTERAMLASELYVTGGWRYERIGGAGQRFKLAQPSGSTSPCSPIFLFGAVLAAEFGFTDLDGNQLTSPRGTTLVGKFSRPRAAGGLLARSGSLPMWRRLAA
jgi:hypothetical protein